MLCLSLELLFLVPEPPPGRPIHGLTPSRFTESRGRLIQVFGSVYPFLILQYKLYDYGGLPLWALIRLWALGL